MRVISNMAWKEKAEGGVFAEAEPEAAFKEFVSSQPVRPPPMADGSDPPLWEWVVYRYLQLGWAARQNVVMTNWFGAFIIFNILLVGVTTGLSI